MWHIDFKGSISTLSYFSETACVSEVDRRGSLVWCCNWKWRNRVVMSKFLNWGMSYFSPALLKLHDRSSPLYFTVFDHYLHMICLLLGCKVFDFCFVILTKQKIISMFPQEGIATKCNIHSKIQVIWNLKRTRWLISIFTYSVHCFDEYLALCWWFFSSGWYWILLPSTYIVADRSQLAACPPHCYMFLTG